MLAHDGPDRAHFLLERLAGRASRAGARLPLGRPDAVREHDPGVRGAAVPGRPRRSSAASARSSAGTRWRPCCRRTRTPRSSAATSPATSRRRRSTRSASTTSGTRRPASTAATSSSSRATRRPGIYARAFLEGRLTRGAAAALPPGGRARRFDAADLVLPAPVADAGLLAVPDRLDGPRPAHGDLPGALHEVPAGPRHRRHRGPQGVGVPRRRRDGRARVAGRDLARRPRAPRQPRLRRQLQPAAPRRPGARQRQDHPGARDELPRRGLERHQGRSGARAGTRCSRPTTRACSCAHGGGGRRRVPDVQVARRRLRARALLRRRPGAARDGRAT